MIWLEGMATKYYKLKEKFICIAQHQIILGCFHATSNLWCVLSLLNLTSTLWILLIIQPFLQPIENMDTFDKQHTCANLNTSHSFPSIQFLLQLQCKYILGWWTNCALNKYLSNLFNMRGLMYVVITLVQFLHLCTIEAVG